MDNAFVRSTQDVLKQFDVTEQGGLSVSQIAASREKHGRNGTLDSSSSRIYNKPEY